MIKLTNSDKILKKLNFLHKTEKTPSWRFLRLGKEEGRTELLGSRLGWVRALPDAPELQVEASRFWISFRLQL